MSILLQGNLSTDLLTRLQSLEKGWKESMDSLHAKIVITHLARLQQKQSTGISGVLGVLDFETQGYALSYYQCDHSTWFDVASLTKCFIGSRLGLLLKQTEKLSLSKMMTQEEKFQLYLLLNHQAGLPSGGLVSFQNWKELLLSYPLPSFAEQNDDNKNLDWLQRTYRYPTIYSDFSHLRLGLFWNQLCEKYKVSHEKWEALAKTFLDPSKDLRWAQDLSISDREKAAITGFRDGQEIKGFCHDPNYHLLQIKTHERAFHTGLFSTGKGICHYLLNWNQTEGFIDEMNQSLETLYHFYQAQYENIKFPEALLDKSLPRFVWGFERPTIEKTLYGQLSKTVCGHMGFTGTHIALDVHRKRGVFLLTNATYYSWYSKKILNQMRRDVSEKILSC
jgi:CubicO group peptidase (beta-lactamase class C family)